MLRRRIEGDINHSEAIADALSQLDVEMMDEFKAVLIDFYRHEAATPSSSGSVNQEIADALSLLQG